MRILDPAVSSVQDAGRPRARRYGFPPGGPLDVEAWAIANALVGNPPGAAAVEVLAGAFHAELRGRVAVGGFDARLEVDGRDVDPWTVAEVHERVRVVARTTAYLAVAGGIVSPEVLGSRSSLGDRLQAGDVVPIGVAAGQPRALARPPTSGTGPLRVVPGPQADRFAADALSAVRWTVGADVDRMGVRLAGPPLPGGRGELLPDGIVPGAIQVPPDGQPIILLADGPTTGGYPKIGVVATVDLGRTGRLRPGDEVAFELVTVDQAHALRAEAPDAVATTRPVADAQALRTANLVSGAVHVDEERA